MNSENGFSSDEYIFHFNEYSQIEKVIKNDSEFAEQFDRL